MRQLFSLSLAVVLAASSTAHAEDTRSVPGAVALSVGSTIAGWVMVGETPASAWSGNSTTGVELLAYAGGALVSIGPSAGHLYAGEYEHALLFTAVRGLAFTSVAYGVSCSRNDDLFGDPDEGTGAHTCSGAGALIVLGGAALAGLTIYDLIDSPRAVDRYNHRGDGPAIVPLIMRDAASHEALGAGIVGRF